jgi:phthiocerol/phenolphthiocerol synthesis type-I polyketide synthase C
LPARDPDFDRASHALLTRAVGIAYGPAFQCIDHGWIEGRSVLAVYRIPDAVDSQLAQTHLHPALLDCAFPARLPAAEGGGRVSRGRRLRADAPWDASLSAAARRPCSRGRRC